MIGAAVVLVTDPRWSDDRIVAVAEAAGAALGSSFVVQVRDRAAPPAVLASRLRDATRATGSRLFVNRWTELARDVDADGLHGAPFDRPFTLPAHDDEELARAVALGASAVLVSPIFASPGKGPPRGVSFVAHARARVPAAVDVVALGGVDETNAAACRAAGAQGVAVMRALLDAARPDEAALRLAGRAGG